MEKLIFLYITAQSVFSLGNKIVVLVIIVMIIKILMDMFLKTENRISSIATGDNETL